MLKILTQFLRKKDELIGIWNKYDDGSGLIVIFGWSLHFFEDGKGKSYYWESQSETCYDFEWQREDKNRIKLRTEDEDWKIVNYKTARHIGAYKSKQTKLTEIGKDMFWNSPEPLYKSR
ncbi:hypothetical protein [Flavobacterium sp.]|uniref:hypothetical protein n=1 Tax=Flavobacterium sp. TaxID=239 RepID=UPI002CB4BD24|nr:hypothetical protein [Flavobacterium sp.]HSD08530.1 hypothetical protein [Flavobacterium sp.]